jgi:fatty acid desaturase/peptidoglycan/LPS O-acetylase OafA/YrhL
MLTRQLTWPRLAIGVHLLIVGTASWQLASTHAKPVYALWASLSGLSLFVLTGLVHEASHHLLARSIWINDLAGNLAGWLVLTPLTAYRAFHLKHHQTTNREGDPNAPLNSRWMLVVGSLFYPALIHFYAWRTLRGNRLLRYLLELAGMIVLLALLVLLPRALRERAWLLPIGIVAVLQNIRIVTEHLDLNAGRYHDTWQLVLPGWASCWLLHYDHHLEHHLRPGLHWHQLPAYRAELMRREPGLGLLRVSLGQYFRDVFWRRERATRRAAVAASSSSATIVDSTSQRDAPLRRLRADRPLAEGKPSPGAGHRFHGLDTLRGVSMVLVVILHAALAYAVVPIPNLIWVVRDPAAHPAFDLICWWSLGISSPFYLMSGFFAGELCRARGLRAFLSNRARRILGPFLAAGVTILPATFFVWVAGWLISGQCTPREIVRMKFHGPGFQRNLYGPAHLWSLEYLVLILAGFAAWMWVRPRFSSPSATVSSDPGWLHRRLHSSWRPLWLAVPTTLILWAGRGYVGLDAIMDRTNSFMPEPFRLLHNAVFFAVGVSLHRTRDDLRRFAHLGWTYLILSVPVFAYRAVLISQDLTQPLGGPSSLMLSLSGALFTWLITFGFLGVALGSNGRPRFALQYLADSSYWVYLCHLPIVGLLQLDLFSVQSPVALKFSIVLTVTMALCLASYQVMVRHTVLGRWLHGRRERFRPSRPITRRPGTSVARSLTVSDENESRNRREAHG